MTGKEIFRLASGFYLTTHTPINFHEMSSRDQREFIDEHVWEPLENWHAYDVLALIEEAADDIIYALCGSTSTDKYTDELIPRD